MRPYKCMDLKLNGKTALVTGGSAGIGRAIAALLASEGVKVAICGRRQERLDAVSEELRRSTGNQVLTYRADVTVPADIDRLVSEAQEDLGGFDILVNNAGTGIYKPFLDVADDELVHGMQMNFFSMFRVSQRVVPWMVQQGGGTIVNVSGISGSSVLDAPFFSTCTGPAKAAEDRFTKALAMEFGPSNIRVNGVAPGRINAPERFGRWQDSIANAADAEMQVQELKKEWGRRIVLPEHRWGEVDEIASLVAFAASPVCGFLTGTILVADGGETHD